MKVLHIITGLSQGGAESALYRLVTDKHNKPEVTHIVISMIDFGTYGQKLKDFGIKVHILEMRKGRLCLKGVLKLWYLIRQIDPDIIQTWMYHADLVGAIVARLAGYRNIFWGVVNFNLDAKLVGKSTRLIAKICGVLSRFVPYKIISCSLNAISKHGEVGYSLSKFVTIPLGYDLSEFRNKKLEGLALRKQWKIAENEIVVGCVARWDKQKDHPNLLKAMAIVNENFPNVVCVMAGTGIEYKNIELKKKINQINREKQRIVLAGRLNNITHAMSAFNVHVLPSLGEAFPNVVAEAMACEVPCVVTDVGDAPVIVGDLGWVVPSSDHVALADAIEEAVVAMQDKANWMKRCYDSRQSILKNYDIERMINAYYKIWKSAL